MLTDAGCFSGLSSRMNGTKKSPHCTTNTKMLTTATPGAISGRTIRRSAWNQPAPSVQAASSKETGTPSMKLFIIEIANGSDVADMNNIVEVIESVMLKCANIEYTGTMIAVIGSPVENTIVYRNRLRNRSW